MDKLNLEHKKAATDWGTHSISYQIGNIGSEVSRALKNQEKPKRFQGAFNRALELFDLTIEDLSKKQQPTRLREICRAREEFCDYFYGNNLKTQPEKMLKYYDQFAMLSRQQMSP